MMQTCGCTHGPKISLVYQPWGFARGMSPFSSLKNNIKTLNKKNFQKSTWKLIEPHVWLKYYSRFASNVFLRAKV